MDKQNWLQLDTKDKIVYIEDQLDRLKATDNRDERKEIEKVIFKLFNWQEDNDE